MFASFNKKPKSSSSQANAILHDWDRTDDWEAVEQLSEVQDVHTLSELFALHRIVHEYKERKGIKEGASDSAGYN